jgi:hypothetical protein
MKSNPTRSCIILGLGLIFLFFLSLLLGNVSEASAGNPGSELIEVYEMAPFLALGGTEPKTGDNIDRLLLNPSGTATIHEAHTGGLPHGGVWVLVVDSAGAVLVLQRAASMRTCPSTWAFVGEHRHPGEEASELVYRAVREELGLDRQWLEKHASPPTRITSATIWERHDYADGRVDRELSELWVVALQVSSGTHAATPTLAALAQKKGGGTTRGGASSFRKEALLAEAAAARVGGDGDVPLRLDAESGGHLWIGLDELEQWLREDRDNHRHPEEGVHVSPRRDFCDSSILDLMELGVSHLRGYLAGTH